MLILNALELRCRQLTEASPDKTEVMMMVITYDFGAEGVWEILVLNVFLH